MAVQTERTLPSQKDEPFCLSALLRVLRFGRLDWGYEEDFLRRYLR
jgi:hypothetical protein